MKINVSHIVHDHVGTLVNARTQRISISDLLLFYVSPLVISAFLVYDLGKLPDAFYGITISVFSIFAALLFSVQVALFNIIQRSPAEAETAKLLEARAVHIERRRELIREVNANISYLILLACLGLSILLFFSVLPRLYTIRAVISCYFVVHFVLTILLVVARVHTLFNEEYVSK